MPGERNPPRTVSFSFFAPFCPVTTVGDPSWPGFHHLDLDEPANTRENATIRPAIQVATRPGACHVIRAARPRRKPRPGGYPRWRRAIPLSWPHPARPPPTWARHPGPDACQLRLAGLPLGVPPEAMSTRGPDRRVVRARCERTTMRKRSQSRWPFFRIPAIISRGYLGQPAFRLPARDACQQVRVPGGQHRAGVVRLGVAAAAIPQGIEASRLGHERG